MFIELRRVDGPLFTYNFNYLTAFSVVNGITTLAFTWGTALVQEKYEDIEALIEGYK